MYLHDVYLCVGCRNLLFCISGVFFFYTYCLTCPRVPFYSMSSSNKSVLRYKMRCVLFIFFVNFILPTAWAYYDNEIQLECKGVRHQNVTLTAYYPDYSEQDDEQAYLDKRGNILNTLQDYLDNRAKFVTLAMDGKLNVPYGTKACIPELNKHFGHRILLEVRDSSSDLEGSAYKRADICVRTEIDSFDFMVNRKVTLVLVD